MLTHTLLLALLGFGSTTLAAPTTPHTNDIRNAPPPPGCVGWVWDMVQICIVGPPTTTIGPSTKRNDEGPRQRDVDALSPFRLVADYNAHQARADEDDTTPTPTSPPDCIPTIVEQFNICIVGPPSTTIVASSKKTRRDVIGLGPVTGGSINPGETVPGGALVPDKTVPGGDLSPST
ncbi:unnamed protein product [Discula destructiva]